MKCLSCKEWEITNDDVFCSKCGRRLREIEVYPNPEDGLIVYLPGNNTQKKTEYFDIRLTNTGSLPYDFQWEIVNDRKNACRLQLKGKDRDSMSRENLIVNPAQSPMNIQLAVDMTKMSDKEFSKLLIHFTEENDHHRTILPIYVSPVPSEIEDINIDIDEEMTIIAGNNSPPAVFKGALELNKSFVVLTKAECSLSNVEIVPRKPMPVPINGFNNGRMEFDILIDYSNWDQKIYDNAKKQHVDAELCFFFLHMEDTPFTKKTKILLREPASLVSSRRQYIIDKLFIGKKEKMTFYIRNDGGLPLTIHHDRIFSHDPWIKPVITYPPSDDSNNVRLDPGKAATVNVEFACRNLKSEEEGYQSYLHFPWDQDKELVVGLVITEISKMHTITDYLAVDFGTTNTCCAYIDGSGTPHLVVLDPDKKAEVIPSILLFDDVENQENPQISIGKAAAATRFLPERIGASVDSFKRHIGTDKKIMISDGENNVLYTPDRLVEFYIKKIIENAESSLNMKVDKVIATFPPAFSLKKLIALKQVYRRLNIHTYEKELDEASAAAIYYIFASKEFENTGEIQHVMVVDFGGGTTDLAMIQCRFQKDERNGKQKIKAKILGVDGDPHFGGEDVTEAIIELLASKFITAVQKAYPKATLPTFSRHSEKNLIFEKFDRSSRKNYFSLYRIAEDFKINFDKEDVPNQEANLSLDLIIDDETVLETATVIVKKEEMNDAIREKIENIIGLINKLKKKTRYQTNGSFDRIDHIFLAGKSSRIRLFKDKIRAEFKSSKIITDSDIAKECVALGAEEFYQLTHSPMSGVEMAIDGFLYKAPNDIGMESRNQNRERVFIPLVKGGESLPAEGKVRIRFSDSGKVGIRIMESLRGQTLIENHRNDFHNLAKIDVDLNDYDVIYTPGELKNAELKLHIDKSRNMSLFFKIGDNDIGPINVVTEGE